MKRKRLDKTLSNEETNKEFPSIVFDNDPDKKGTPELNTFSRNPDFFFKKKLNLEKRSTVSISEALENHAEITVKMRAKLYDWLYQATIALGLDMKTFYITLHIIDTVICRASSIRLEHFQLLGVTALYMSAKFNEVTYRKPETYTALIDGMHSVKELYKCEEQIIKVVSFSAFCEMTIYDYLLKYYEDLFPIIRECDKENFVRTSSARFEPFAVQLNESPMYKKHLTQITELLNFFVYLDISSEFPKNDVALLVIHTVCNIPIHTLQSLSPRIAKRGAIKKKLKQQSKAFVSYIKAKEKLSWYNRYIDDGHYYDQDAFQIYLQNT